MPLLLFSTVIRWSGSPTPVQGTRYLEDSDTRAASFLSSFFNYSSFLFMRNIGKMRRWILFLPFFCLNCSFSNSFSIGWFRSFDDLVTWQVQFELWHVDVWSFWVRVKIACFVDFVYFSFGGSLFVLIFGFGRSKESKFSF